MVRQARDRQFEYLNAQQGALEDKSGDEFWSNPQRGHDLVDMSDLVPLRDEVHTRPIDINEPLMQINIAGRPTCSVTFDYYVPNTSTHSHLQSGKNRLGFHLCLWK
jgi:hypothetical protein